MSLLKTPEEIAKLKEGGKILSDILREIRGLCVAGARTDELDMLARERMGAAGAKPSFFGYRISPDDAPYSGALCISINDEVVHGLAHPGRIIQDGDLVGLDIGMWYMGLATDMATTVAVGAVSDEERALVEDTRGSLVRALGAVKNGGMVADIGAAVQDYLEPKGYGIVKDLVGHGVGHAVHEDPAIPNYREPRAPKVMLQTNMVIAIEPMVTLGTWKIRQKDDGWTIVTADGSKAAHFEVTVAVTDDGYDLVTPWPDRSSN